MAQPHAADSANPRRSINSTGLHGALARLLDTRPVPHAVNLDTQHRDQPLVRPSAQALGEAQQLIGFGAISDLIDWAEYIAIHEPQCAAFARQARRLASLGDLSALEAICRS